MQKVKVEESFACFTENGSFVYSPLDKMLLGITGEGFHFLKDNPTKNSWHKTLDPDESLGLFRRKKPSVYDFVGRESYDGLVLLLTNSCNLKCDYCYASDSHDKPMVIEER